MVAVHHNLRTALEVSLKACCHESFCVPATNSRKFWKYRLRLGRVVSCCEVNVVATSALSDLMSGVSALLSTASATLPTSIFKSTLVAESTLIKLHLRRDCRPEPGHLYLHRVRAGYQLAARVIPIGIRDHLISGALVDIRNENSGRRDKCAGRVGDRSENAAENLLCLDVPQTDATAATRDRTTRENTTPDSNTLLTELDREET
jgi:hypothetical protein